MADADNKDKLVALEKLAPTLGDAKQREILGDSLYNAVSRINGLADRFDRLDALAPFVPILTATIDKNAIRDELGSIEEFGKTLKDAKTPDEFKAISATASTFALSIQALEREVQRAWSSRVTKAIGPTDRLGNVLTRIEGSGALGRELIAIANEARALAATVNDADKETKSLERLRDRAEKAKDKAMTGDKLVDQFLTALAEQKATLADVTPAVLAWAKKIGALQQLHVRL